MTKQHETKESPTARVGVFSAFRLSTLTSLAVTASGVATNKLIAILTGTNGVALLGIYRSLSAVLATGLPLGSNDVITRHLSIAREDERIDATIAASFWLLCAQAATACLIALLLGRPLSALVFSAAEAEIHVFEVRAVLVLSIGVLALQNVTAVLNGLVRVREVTRIGLITSLATLATTYPFLLLGPVGLTLIIGATCFVGAGVGAAYVIRVRSLSALAKSAPRSLSALHSVVPLSPWLALHPMIVTASGLAVQSLIGHRWGLSELGFFNAASMIETTGMMVLMSPMRSYLLPTLGNLDEHVDKQTIANRLFTIMFPLLLVGVSVMVLLGGIVMRVFFSSAFAAAGDLVGVLGLSMVPQVFVWFSAMFLIHKGDYRTLIIVDGSWALVQAAGTLAVGNQSYSLLAAAWVHVLSFVASSLAYGLIIRRRYGGSLLGIGHWLSGAAVLAALFVTTRTGSTLEMRMLAAAPLVALLGWFALRMKNEMGGPT